MSLSIVILAAGQGKRMMSQLPKVLHLLAGKPLLEHIVQTVHPLLAENKTPLVVYGHQGEQVRTALHYLPVTWVSQTQQLGTGHALMQALPHIPPDDQVLVLCGDTPLITFSTLKKLISSTPREAPGMITAHLAQPFGLGRIIRDANHRIFQIVEEKDLREAQRNIHEINAGIYLFPPGFLAKTLPLLKNNNAQKEYYLTDVINQTAKDHLPIHSLSPQAPHEILGVNNRAQLAEVERIYQHLKAEQLMLQGVTIMDPKRLDIRGELVVGEDVVIDVNVIFEGQVTLGKRCHIGANTLLRNVTLLDDVLVKPYSFLENAHVASRSTVGPYARIRPGTFLEEETHIGNFVEIKNSRVGAGTKINHLSYIGDSEIGKRVNIGAGTITCNYDGANKHRTVIGDETFIGSNSSLVAPLHIGEGATIGAGSTITRDAPSHQLSVCRALQRSISHWQRPQKKET